jgi:hypothetical protein
MKQPKRIDGNILKSIMDKAHVKIARAYQMIDQARRQYVVSRRTAANFVAWKLGVDIQKFDLTPQDLDELKELIKRVQLPTPIIQRVSKPPQEAVIVQIGRKPVDTLILPPSLGREAEKMSEVYSLIYVLENSFRHLIRGILEKKHGSDWWNRANIPSDIKKLVESRQKHEEANRWHAKRGAHEIYYTDFNDLGRIIVNNWDDFRQIFLKQHRLRTKLEEIELSRNIVAHSNPLPDREVRRLKLNFEDWKRILQLKP